MKRTFFVALALSLLATFAPATAANYHIVSGAPAAQGAYPWMAAFLFDGGQGCGGSVVAPNWILTAAHCVADDRGQPSVTPGQVSFVVDSNNWTDGTGQTLTAAEIVIHPQYDALVTNNDVALVRVNETARVAPVRMAGPGDLALNAPPTQARVIGYGTIQTGGPQSEVLLQVDVDVVSDADCAASGYGQLVNDTMVCAGNPSTDSANPGRDSCQGDSGGPLFATVDNTPIQFGIVSFGGECGVNQPGVYSEVTTFRQWIDGIVGNQIQQGQPDPGPASQQPTGAAVAPLRIAGGDGNDPVANAIAISQLIFQTPGEFGVLAASGNFPDALGGSALASYFGPLLYVDAAGQLGDATLLEFQRTVPAGGIVYILGGEAVIGPAVAQRLTDAGFDVRRLGGTGRQQTAALVADEVNRVVNDGPPPFNSVIVAFEGNWPDAVAVGQISSWFGIPILLTPTNSLGGPARDYIAANTPDLVMVLGGEAVVSQEVRDEIEALLPEDGFIQPLFGNTRLETGADVTFYNRFELFPQNNDVFVSDDGGLPTTPDAIVAVNLRRDDAFAHVLAASMITGNAGAVFAPLEGDGTSVDASVLESICGMNVEVIAIGGVDLVKDSALAQLQEASARTDCELAG